MRSRFFVLSALLALAYLHQPATATATDALCIVALGDSITKGSRPAKATIPAVLPEETFCSILNQKLTAEGYNTQVINSGVPSNRTDQGVARLKADVLSHKPNIVLIMYGTNDSCWDKDKTGPRLPLADYRKNLETIIAEIRQSGGTPILMTPIPLKLGWGKARNTIYVQNGENGAILPYVEACRELSVAQKVPLVDNFALWTDRGVEYIKPLLPDGCHPNAAGHQVLANDILPILLKELSAPPKAPSSNAQKS